MDKANGNEEERKFLHDISNHLLVAHGMGTFINKAVKEKFDEDSKEFQRSQKTIDALDKIIQLVKDRRNVVHEEDHD